jgi:flagellin
MATRIYTNIAALTAHSNLLINDSALSKSIERLSSGLRINRAADDPAGLVISENLRTQVAGLTQAIANSNDSANMVKTAEGSLSEVHSLLRSMRTLALHAANAGVNDQTAIEADQQQISSAIESLNRIASQTQFGTVKLLNGTIGTSYTTAMPNIVTGVSGYFADACTGMATVTVTQQAAQAEETGSNSYGSLSSTVSAGTIIVNGVNIGTFTTDHTIQNVIDAINAKTSQTGVVVSLDGGTSGSMIVKQTAYGSDYKVAYSDTGAIFDSTATTFTTAGTDAQGSVTFVGGSTVTLNSGKGLIMSSAGGAFKVGLTALATATDYANAFQVTMGNAQFQIGANAAQTVDVSIDDISATQLGTTVDSNGVAGIDVTSDPDTAIQVLDEAISQISTLRARLGAFQKNVLESNINSLMAAVQNVSASESAIRDTDMAAEVVDFTRNQVLVQAGTAMLAQANAAPQSILSLLS